MNDPKDRDQSPIIPELEGIPEDDEAEPLDAGPEHVHSPEEES